jgi:outer membrane receptor protein involved in Fe transport
LLQANLQTPREFFAANPGTNPNAFLGQFLTFATPGFTNTAAFLTVPNTGAGAGVLPRVAVPLAFDNAGNLVDITNCITPSTPATAGSTPCSSSFQNPAFFNILRTEQRRDIGNLFAHFDVTDNLTVYTEALVAKIETVSPQNNVASANTIGSTTTENGALLFSINNPFLDAADRARLVAAGVNATTGTFLLSRTNQDLAPNGLNPITNYSDTYRLVGGVKGSFGLLGQTHRYDASVTFGRNDANYNRLGLLDVEYALALDAVRDPATGNTVCRAQIDRAGALGTRNLPRGITSADIIRVPQADGSFKEEIRIRTVSEAQIAACRPLNPFGFNQLSEASRDYVTDNTQFTNRNDQLFTQASVAGSLFNLPGGSLGYALSGEYRKDEVDFGVDPDISALGRTRSAVLARTQGMVENIELGAEARIPIFGDDFNFPLLRNLDFNPAIRFVKQTGDAPDVTLLNGNRLANESDSGWNRIYSLAATYRPVRDITVRGNITRSLRQPSVVELFLGGQPAFNAYTDPCSNGSIGGGNTPALRRSNCQQAVIAAGFATNAAEADTFLASFNNPGNSIQGSFAGSPDLKPEKGESWTVGVAANPSFIPGLRLSADYIDVKLRDRIIPTTLTQALQLCFDSTTFGDTSGQVGVNTCNFFTRATSTNTTEPAFIPQNGFASGFINLGALQVNALNMTASYNVPISQWLGSEVGELELYANAYHLIHYRTSSTGNLNDRNVVFDLAGSAAQPDWEVQGRARYEHPSGVYGQWTTNYTDKSCAIGSADVCATNEEFDLLRIPAIVTHDLALGISFGERRRFGLQLAISNLFDKRYVVNESQALALGIGGNVDTFGRRFRLSTNVRF